MQQKLWSARGFLILISMPVLLFAGAAGAADNNTGPAPSLRPSPPDVAGLRTIVAEPWLKVSDEGLILEGPCFDRQGNLYVTLGVFGPAEKKILKITPDKKIAGDIQLSDRQLRRDGHSQGRENLCRLPRRRADLDEP